jgi:hypothetical protein
MNEMMKHEIAEMQKQNHYLMVRVKELSSEVCSLRKQLGLNDEYQRKNCPENGRTTGDDGIEPTSFESTEGC